MAGSILKVDNLSVHFGGVSALTNLSFDVREKAITSVIGPNGAGKTSLFNCLTGFYRPNRGAIEFQGRRVNGLRPHSITRLGIARTFQNLRLFRGMTVLENVMSGLHCRTHAGIAEALLGLPSQRREEKEIRASSVKWLDYVGIADLADKVADSLSYGNQRRVEWARALATQPKLLLLDEPGAGMNNDEKAHMIKLIRRIREDLGVTVLLIEHDMSLVMNVSEAIVVLNYGEKIAEGTADEVRKIPKVIEAYLGVEA